MAPWRGEDISSFKRLTCHPKRLQPQGRAVPPGAGREGLWGELAQRLWTGGPPSSCSASLVTWPHPQWGGHGADLSHLPCSQTSPVPSPGDMLIPAPSPGQGLPVDLLSELGLGQLLPWSMAHTRGIEMEWNSSSLSIRRESGLGRQLTKCPRDPSEPPWE